MKYINVLSTRVQNTKKYKILIEHMYKIQKYREKIPTIEYKTILPKYLNFNNNFKSKGINQYDTN